MSASVALALPLQAAPDALVGTPWGKLLLALVALAVVLVVGRFVMDVAWKVLRIAIVGVGVLWLLSVVLPML
jgi:hypothetical protein